MLLEQAFRARISADVTWTNLDDRWYREDLGGFGTGTGDPLWISPETIYLCDVVLAAVRFLSDAISVCPPAVFARVGDERRAVPAHYAQRVLRHPNRWQTGFEWRSINVTWTATWGNAYNRVVAGPDSFAQQFWPLHPSRTRVVDQASDGSLIYSHTPKNGPRELLTQDEVLHYRGISFDGIEGAKIYVLIRNAVAIALAAQQHVLTFMRKGTRLAGLLIPKSPLGPEQRKEVGDSWNDSFGGPNTTGTVGVMPFDFEFKPLSEGNQKGQVLELTNAQIESILRSLGVPGVVVGYQGDKASTYASADAFFEKGGMRQCVMPRLVSFEQREEKVLLPEGSEFFIKHNMDALLRAATKDRYEALVRASGRPFMTGNEARAIEDMNRSDDPSMDQVALPLNMTGEDKAPSPTPEPGPPPRRKPKPPPPPDDDGADATSRQFIRDAAARIVRREIAAIKDRVPLAARDPQGWKAWLESYYAKHGDAVAQTMHLSEAAARAYAARQVQAVAQGGVSVVADWEATEGPELELVAMALSEGYREEDAS